MHHRILVVDGALAFGGGVGIADVWTGDDEDPEHWRETHCTRSTPAGSATAVSPRTFEDALCGAAQRGVDVRILVDGQQVDKEVARQAGHRSYGKLLQAR